MQGLRAGICHDDGEVDGVTVATLHPERRLFRSLEMFILASESPRRRRLLRSLGLEFEVVVSGVEETQPVQGSPEVQVRGWAGEKAEAVAGLHPDRWVLAADTIVVLAGVIFGKPAHAADARRMLEQLSDREHQVITAVCLRHALKNHREIDAVVTRVRFKRLMAAEIDAYLASGEPFDKAGAYGIQGLGACLVRSVCGSYTNVVGLPLCETVEHLMGQGIIAPC
jgi:septum formation protein